ncbi:hypothetical protein GCM10007424_07270 [Flavobacterium suaedae]|uniref:Uncharacterized protein n=1 Tax=Flavobacterium suaedae TaxID=1767027 RepID=A0ABQ1JM85_9FLAO|nr:hypothetical protein GCM10007424_07270 [Flavobacterium suaedae]
MFFNKSVNDQNIKSMVKAAETTDTILTIKAIFSLPEANMAKNAPVNWYKGAPGGCPTCSFAEVEIYSPLSQKLTVGSTVIV